MNRYFICLPFSREPVAWNPADPSDRPIADCNYFGTVLTHLEALGDRRSWEVYVTWDVTWLPRYGPDVIAIVLGDEWCREPLYATRVAAIFKCYGTRRKFWPAPYADELATLLLIQSLHIQYGRLPFAFASLRNRLRRRKSRIYDVPIGYYKQQELPIVPISERTHDLFFAGSMQQEVRRRGFPLSLLQQPKTLSRAQMITVLAAYRNEHPRRVVELQTTANFHVSAAADGNSYSRALQNTKICVVPRGTSEETFRWFEGLRYGCIIICERLPDRRYYTGAPVIVLDRWNSLPETLERILTDPVSMEKYHTESLRWWTERCSESATARYIHERLPR